MGQGRNKEKVMIKIQHIRTVDEVNTVHGKFIALNIYVRKEERSQLMASASIFKRLEGKKKKRKPKASMKKEGITMSTRTNKTKNK